MVRVVEVDTVVAEMVAEMTAATDAEQVIVWTLQPVCVAQLESGSGKNLFILKNAWPCQNSATRIRCPFRTPPPDVVFQHHFAHTKHHRTSLVFPLRSSKTKLPFGVFK